MAQIKLYIATTIDGFIARKNGELDWLNEIPNPNQIDYGYYGFYNGIDTVIMGRKTYDEILGFGVDWPYSNCKAHIVTSNKSYEIKTPHTFLLNQVTQEVIKQLKAESSKNIWLVGGGELITHFLNLGAIDEMLLTIIPIILGEGIRLFPNEPKETTFKLINTEAFETGLVNLTYQKKHI